MANNFEYLDKAADTRYYTYGVAVNEDRAIPCDIDGMKPVMRRCLWAVHKLGGHSKAKVAKSAQYVGEVMGHFHPHGDAAIYQTYVTMANSCVKTIDGEGNWGSLSDPNAASMRYTNLRMSNYAETVFFDKFYLPIIPMVDNYDGSRKEPLILPALLPNLLLNGDFGIGVGVRTEIPSFTPESVIALIKKLILEKRECTAQDCMSLKFSSRFGGEAVVNKTEIESLHKTGKGKVLFKSIYEKSKEKNCIEITKFAPFSNIANILNKVCLLPVVVNANDISDVKDVYGRIFIKFKPSLKESEFETASKKVISTVFSCYKHFDIKITKRSLDEKGNSVSKLSSSTVPTIINAWLKYRIDLEKKACLYWANEIKNEIEMKQLSVLAATHIDIIIAILKEKGKTNEQCTAKLAKQLNITNDKAEVIWGMTVGSLRALNIIKIKQKIKELKKERTELEFYARNPRKRIIKGLVDISKICV